MNNQWYKDKWYEDDVNCISLNTGKGIIVSAWDKNILKNQLQANLITNLEYLEGIKALEDILGKK